MKDGEDLLELLVLKLRWLRLPGMAKLVAARMIDRVGDLADEVLESEPAACEHDEAICVRRTRRVEHVGHDDVEIAEAADGRQLVRRIGGLKGRGQWT